MTVNGVGERLKGEQVSSKIKSCLWRHQAGSSL